MRWPWPRRRAVALPDRRDEAARAVEQSRADHAEYVRRHSSRIGRIHAALMHEATVNHFTERWQEQIHPKGGRA